MALLAIDLGGTKLALGIFSSEGILLHQYKLPLESRKGAAVGALIAGEINKFVNESIYKNKIDAIGICVPGISHKTTGTIWAPNIQGWEDYPLYSEVQKIVPDIPLIIEGDRGCYILGEAWKGNATGCTDAIYLAVGTGIGAGILCDGRIINGAHDISGAVGWMALSMPYQEIYRSGGDFEYHASGPGIARMARHYLQENTSYIGELNKQDLNSITTQDVFTAFDNNDPVAQKVMHTCIQYWGMAVANLVSIFNPEKIILGGGVFGPAKRFIPDIKNEAKKWAQPIAMQRVTLETSMLGYHAGLYGAGHMALQLINRPNNSVA
jgi:glucokinase